MMFTHINIINRHVLSMQKCNTRSFGFQNVKEAFSKCFASPKPPYNHICQIGDPVLRSKATPVDPKVIQTQEFQKILEQLTNVMRNYQAQALSAPQIGLPLQIFVIEVTEKFLNKVNPELRQFCEMEPIPLMYFINPAMEIINPEEVTFIEVCGSVIGFRAQVPRAKEVEIKALNPLGESFRWKVKGWSARVAQHEFDHLQGILYTDKMDPSTFEFAHWQVLNEKKGKIQIKYRL